MTLDHLVPHALPLAESGAVFGILMLIAGLVAIASNVAKNQKKKADLANQRDPNTPTPTPTTTPTSSTTTTETELDERIRDRFAERQQKREQRQSNRNQRNRDREDQFAEGRRYSEPKVEKLAEVVEAIAFTPITSTPATLKPIRATESSALASQRLTHSSPAHRLNRVLRNRQSARSMIVASEVLARPVALRDQPL